MHSTTPAFLALLFCLSVAIIVVKKENVVVPLIISMCFLPADISVKVGTLDFYAVRVIALIGILRIYACGEHGRIRLNTIDHYFIAYNLLGTVIYLLASQNKVGALIFKSGVFVDSIIIYLFIRYSIYSRESIYLIMKTFAVCVLILLPFTVFEFYSAKNLFSILGRSAISVRDGEIRAAGTFSHAILYGSFAAALVPFLWADYKFEKSKLKLLSVFCCVFIVYASSSSGPIVALAGMVCFLIFFRWKQYSSLLAKGIFFTALFIHLVRESPIWHFMYVRISIKGSSTGYHRYLLVDAAVKEFWNWWLLGYGDAGPQWHTKYWPHTYARFTDVTNHYLLEGVRGGFFTMLLFMLLCYKAIKILVTHSKYQEDLPGQWLWWGIAVMMMGHCISFLSVAYFGQITMLLYLTIALAAYAYDEHYQLADG